MSNLPRRKSPSSGYLRIKKVSCSSMRTYLISVVTQLFFALEIDVSDRGCSVSDGKNVI